MNEVRRGTGLMLSGSELTLIQVEKHITSLTI